MLTTLWIAVTTAGCILFGGVRGPERVPTTIGVITAIEPGTATGQSFALADGRVVTIPADAELLKGAVGAQPGDLLLADTSAQEPWWIALREIDHWPFIERCFLLGSGYAEDRNGQVITQEGLVIEKAPVYDPGGAAHDGRYENPRGNAFCLNAEGRALAAS
jgi:hypothetical protein